MSTVVKDLGAVSAYAYAVEKGYTGTEEEFAELMASYATVGQTAVDAKDAAVAAKTAAQTAATTATNKASEATTAAQTATTKAGEASQSASQAQASVQTASTKASEASQSASTASAKATEATTAAATATSAVTTATTAKDDAVSAKTAAQAAQTGAETAAASVQSSAAQIATNATDISQLKEELTDVFTDLTELSKEVDGNIPLRYRTTTGTANETVPLIAHFALEKSTQYTFTFRIKEAINTNVYFYIYKNQETSLLTKKLSAGDTSAVYTYTTSSSVPFTDGKIDVKVNKANVYCEVEIKATSAIQSRLDKLIDQPLTSFPSYISGNLAYKPLGSLTKPYICLVSDDGNASLNTYTIPMLLNKDVPCTFALMQSSAVMADQTNIDIVKNAITNGGCSVAQHGGHYWTQFTEKSLNTFFDSEATFFSANGIDVKGAVLPGHYCNDMIASLVGGRFGVVRSGYNGNGTSRMVNYHLGGTNMYGNGARSNLYQLTSFNVQDYSEQLIKTAIDTAVANNYLIFIYWHDNSLTDADKTRLEAIIDYAKTTTINFITLGDVLSIT